MTTLTQPSHAGITTSAAQAVIAIGRAAAPLALAALLAGGTLMAIAGALSAAEPTDPWRPVRDHAAVFAGAAIALALVSLFDLFTVPALHQRLSARNPGLILVATLTAAVGDLLGIAGRLIQAGEVPAASSSPEGAALFSILEQTLNTAGFILVSVSFCCFGIAMLNGFHRWLGIVGIVAGASTGLGQLPGLEPVFAAANLAFIAWYVGLAVHLRPA